MNGGVLRSSESSTLDHTSHMKRRSNAVVTECRVVTLVRQAYIDVRREECDLVASAQAKICEFMALTAIIFSTPLDKEDSNKI